MQSNKKNMKWEILGLVAFFSGVIIANYLAIYMKEEMVAVFLYYEKRFLYLNTCFLELLLYIMCRRAPSFLFLYLAVIRWKKKGILPCFLFLLMMSGSFLMTCSMIVHGIKGVILTLGIGFPQWGFYLFGFYLAEWEQREGDDFAPLKVRVKRSGMILLLILLGFVSEAGVNPYIVKGLLQIF